jgi:hypothetical protein
MGKRSRQCASPHRMGWGESRIIFYTYYQDIQDLLGLGWSLRKIHKHLFAADQQLSYGQLSYHQIKVIRARQVTEPELIPETPPVNLTKPKLPQGAGKPDRHPYKPGPRIPDPKELY